MAIAYDSSAAAHNGSTSSLSFSLTTSGSDRLLFVFFMIPTANSVSSVTYGGVAMTTVGVTKTVSTYKLYGYYLANPTLGANNIQITQNTAGVLYAGAASYKGCSQSGIPDAAGTRNATETTSNVAITTVANNCWLVMASRGAANGDTNAGTATTERQADNGYVQIYDSNGAKSAGATQLQTTQSSQETAHIIVSFKPSMPGAAFLLNFV